MFSVRDIMKLAVVCLLRSGSVSQKCGDQIHIATTNKLCISCISEKLYDCKGKLIHIMGVGCMVLYNFNNFTSSIQSPKTCLTFRNTLIYCADQFLTPRPVPRLEDHPLSDLRDCLWSDTFASTARTCRPFPPPAT